jgi:hypothetical protein
MKKRNLVFVREVVTLPGQSDVVGLRLQFSVSSAASFLRFLSRSNSYSSISNLSADQLIYFPSHFSFLKGLFGLT